VCAMASGRNTVQRVACLLRTAADGNDQAPSALATHAMVQLSGICICVKGRCGKIMRQAASAYSLLPESVFPAASQIWSLADLTACQLHSHFRYSFPIHDSHVA
jgi:hypothetical protein